MKTEKGQTAEEERLNVITHAIGFIFALFGSIFLIVNGLSEGIHLRFICYLIYCIGLITLYLASTLYHSEKEPGRKKRLNIFDHSSIYLMIAGTYTPITVLTIKGLWGWAILSLVWAIALAGIILKFFFTGRYSKISTATYILMGWVIIIALKPLLESMIIQGLMWLLAGGLFYTIGAILYQYKSLKYNHVVFHILVFMGSLCHYIVFLNYTN